MFLARLVNYLRPFLFWNQCQRLRHGLIERLGAETATDDENAKDAATLCKLNCRLSQRGNFRAHRIATPFAFLEYVRKAGEDASGKPCQDLVGQAGDRILFV